MVYEDFATANMGFSLLFIIFIVIAMVYLLWRITSERIQDGEIEVYEFEKEIEDE